MPDHNVPGFLAVSHDVGAPEGPDLQKALALVGVADATLVHLPHIELATWGLGAGRPTPDVPLLLSGTNWSESGSVPAARLGQWLSADSAEPPRPMLPPFAALGAAGDGLMLASDTMGFRQLFDRRGPGWQALSTSARALAALGDGRLDREAMLLQSLLGWQLGQRTLFADVTKFGPGEYVHLIDGTVVRGVVGAAEAEPVSLDEATNRAAGVLRSFLERYLDENPDPTLQLTGGQDSRLVLSAIPAARRKGLKVMTMGLPGTADVDTAASLAARCGMQHTVHGLDGLDLLSPADSFARACEAAARLDCMADPIAKAATLWAEEHFTQGARLSGLGGEIARGFYYTGVVRDTPVTRARTKRLARWRMFANEAVQTAALDPGFVAEAQPVSLGMVHRALTETGLEWYRATDALYLNHRMQRWAGLSESAVCFDRQIVNPMLDDRFRIIAQGLVPRDKARGQFLARLQVTLDPELASLPLDNRPAPAVLARPGVVGRVRHQAATTTRLARKVKQRVSGSRRPPQGGAVLANKITQHLRAEPEALDRLRGRGVVNDEWLDGVASGTATADPATLAFLLNLLVATG
jgi:asparagine synthase (glutamine-hydrolysing)